MTAEAQAGVTPWLAVADYRHPDGWATPHADDRARAYCDLLERGEILFFNSIAHELPRERIDFLLAQRRGDSRLHKNISYRPEQDVLRGAEGDAETQRALHAAMRDYSAAVVRFASDFLRPYAAKWKLDYASYRPL